MTWVKWDLNRAHCASSQPIPRSMMDLTLQPASCPRWEPAFPAAGAWRARGPQLPRRPLPTRPPASAQVRRQAVGIRGLPAMEDGGPQHDSLSSTCCIHWGGGAAWRRLFVLLIPSPPPPKQNPGLARNLGKQAMEKEIPLIRRRNIIKWRTLAAYAGNVNLKTE